MQLNKKTIKEFQEIYKKEFNEKIDEKRAEEIATRLINLLITVYKPTNKKYKQSQRSTKKQY